MEITEFKVSLKKDDIIIYFCIKTIKVYNTDNWLESITNYKKFNNEVLSSFLYTYDKVGNRLSMNEEGDITNYEYDVFTGLLMLNILQRC